jgi:hypothetical protein
MLPDRSAIDLECIAEPGPCLPTWNPKHDVVRREDALVWRTPADDQLLLVSLLGYQEGQPLLVLDKVGAKPIEYVICPRQPRQLGLLSGSPRPGPDGHPENRGDEYGPTDRSRHTFNFQLSTFNFSL